ncbi:hypothetical protein CQW49_22590 (plasmid) [Methylosinus trichosporium OB3b]|uniref:Uncharacterized protein n=2 Tax=Methylosinus trichosporium TaxID=426 RepID=A0A2D2D721_METT3|nr:hypothetical protein CQW49_22590 [Methylosinus trichosporium OB3b]
MAPSKRETERLIETFDIEPLDLDQIEDQAKHFVEFFAMTFAETMPEQDFHQFLEDIASSISRAAATAAERSHREMTAFPTDDPTVSFQRAVAAVLAGGLRVAAEAASARSQVWLR